MRFANLVAFVLSAYVELLPYLIIYGRIFASASGELTTSGSVSGLWIGAFIVAATFGWLGACVFQLIVKRGQR